MKKKYKRDRKLIEQKINLFIKRMYVISFNAYAFYWLYKLIWINDSSTWEDYLLYLFTVAGMHYFVLENQDLFFRNQSGKKV